MSIRDNELRNLEKVKREDALILANQEKDKWADELVLANAEKDKRADELVLANAEKDKRAGELVLANAELACTSSDHLGPISPFSKRHFSASYFSMLAC